MPEDASNAALQMMYDIQRKHEALLLSLDSFVPQVTNSAEKQRDQKAHSKRMAVALRLAPRLRHLEARVRRALEPPNRSTPRPISSFRTPPWSPKSSPSSTSGEAERSQPSGRSLPPPPHVSAPDPPAPYVKSLLQSPSMAVGPHLIQHTSSRNAAVAPCPPGLPSPVTLNIPKAFVGSPRPRQTLSARSGPASAAHETPTHPASPLLAALNARAQNASATNFSPLRVATAPLVRAAPPRTPQNSPTGPATPSPRRTGAAYHPREERLMKHLSEWELYNDKPEPYLENLRRLGVI